MFYVFMLLGLVYILLIIIIIVVVVAISWMPVIHKKYIIVYVTIAKIQVLITLILYFNIKLI